MGSIMFDLPFGLKRQRLKDSIGIQHSKQYRSGVCYQVEFSVTLTAFLRIIEKIRYYVDVFFLQQIYSLGKMEIAVKWK